LVVLRKYFSKNIEFKNIEDIFLVKSD